ncbi:MAG: cysteine desulfurase family protein [Pseudomonadota bacterium]
MIYLDYNATAPMRPKVRQAMLDSFDHFGNPSSVHALGRKARALIENARATVAQSINTIESNVVFTSGGTEANNLAILGLVQTGAKCLVSAIEHDSVIEFAGPQEQIAVTAGGLVDLQYLERKLGEVRCNYSGPLLIAVMLANNETGVVQPIQEVVTLAKRYQTYVHCDAVQAFGKLPIDFQELGVDSMALSAHKIGGPKGIGTLIVGKHLNLVSLLKGPGQERGMRAGTESMTNIVGFQTAIQDAVSDDWQHVARLRDSLEDTLQRVCPTLKVYGRGCLRLPNTSCIMMPGVASQKQLMNFDLQGIAVSAGAACSSGKAKFSHVLKAMGVEASEASQALRVSLGWQTTQTDIEKFTQVWTKIYQRHCKEAV